MKLLNLGCGYPRLGPPFINVDTLRAQLRAESPELADLDAEPNYVESDLRARLPFEDQSFDGCLLSHVLEHFDAQEGLALLIEIYRVLVPVGVVLVSVPNASYFRQVHPQDHNGNWPRLFEVNDPPNPIPTFFEAALWFNEHKAILTEDAIWCYLTRAGFAARHASVIYPHHAALDLMLPQLNRRKFSVEMIGAK